MLEFNKYLLEAITETSKGITFGIEIEIPTKDNYDVLHITNVFRNLGKKLSWDLSIDYSCIPGIEIKTKYGIDSANLHQLEEDLTNISKILDQYVDREKFNEHKCGTHVHIGGLDENSKKLVYDIWKNHFQEYQKI